jgi:hypothetical protein
LIDSGVNPYDRTRRLMREAVSSLLAAGVAEGSIRGDVDVADVIAGLTGIALASGTPEQRDQAERLLDLFMDGLASSR